MTRGRRRGQTYKKTPSGLRVNAPSSEVTVRKLTPEEWENRRRPIRSTVSP